MSRIGRTVIVAGLVTGVLVSGAAAPAAAATTATIDHTSAKERKRVDSVPTPKLGWYDCYRVAQCATIRLPLDYDKPKGPKTEIAILRIKAKDQKHKIGSLFLNPGGPGGSGTSIALNAPYFLSKTLLDRFDIVGFDPRGIANSDNVRCFKSVKDQAAVLNKMNVAFPWGAAEEKKYVGAAKQFGKACSTTGKPLSGSMSTAEVARDMDVLRRAVGDKKLNYLGFSYGTAIGQYYANMFPDRFRSIVVDGVLDPAHWVGTKKTANQEQDERLRSADGAYRALREILKRCDAAGEKYCVFAAGDPVANFDLIAQKLRKKPLVITDETGSYTITYADFVGGILGDLYDTGAGDWVTQDAQYIYTLLTSSSAADKAAARTALAKRIKDARARKPARDFPYENGFEAFSGVDCTDALHPKDANLWPALMAKADKRAPYFGRAWGWSTAQCARNTWTVRDEDAYTGPWTRRTAAPVLIVGTQWDPATNYDDAVSASKRLPNSRLLSNTNWGHTSYGTSDCATTAIDNYLLKGTLPAKGTVCQGAYQPFLEPLPDDSALSVSALRAPAAPAQRPQVVGPPLPSTLSGTR
ncbi:peptidase [Actinoplanes ianthinogenes]|uniref:Peptidase n=1 Tax=Actinoplanes ianthinogenes TaxID=122358 RepID=A0ABM7M3T5_9ACTN|nr:alpha/beta hydrolase [Actinoplanes ianthinogenes]BCJ46257.1 peptidase [Actinoplanes ianthinogenes]GGR27417.1 peptidase [Actinoplanes ianthinogenes]